MPNIKSAKKRVKLINKQTLRNKAIKTNLKTILKKFDSAVAESSSEKDSLFRLAIKKIDQAVAKGVLHKNNASRKKSKLTVKYNLSK
ncbi:MAG: 30S ribosomal protein S20 [Oscillospiraceae bacterium]|nr:30S ribosomal protein S20 [Oscillospiraceae bacterium]